MVQQIYRHRIALGRSPFEPPDQFEGDRRIDDAAVQDDSTVAIGAVNPDEHSQAYDGRGNSQNLASQAQLRRIIRAHNEVYATIGVCARVDSSTQEAASGPANTSPQVPDKADGDENKIALWLIIVDELSTIVASTVSMNFRQRIQTFDFYSGIGLLDIIRIELSCQSILQIFFAGEFAFRTFSLVYGISDALIDVGRDRLITRFVTSQQSTLISRINASIIYGAEKVARLMVFCGLFPIQFYGSLQRLNLLPIWPLLPNLLSGTIFRLALPLELLTRKGGSMTSRSIALATSPVTIFLCTQVFAHHLHAKMTSYAQAVISRPDNPDQTSLKLISNEILDASERVLSHSRYQTSLRMEINKDVFFFKKAFVDLGLDIRSFWRRHVLGKQPIVEFEDLMAEDEAAYVGISPGRFIRTTDNYEPRRLPSTPTSLIITDSTIAPTVDFPVLTPTYSTAEENVNTTNASYVRIRARAGSTSTLHMDVEFTTTDEIGGPVHTSSFASSPNPRPSMETSQAGSSSEQTAIYQAKLTTAVPSFRVTALSLFPADPMSLHIGTTISTILSYPLFAFCTRTTAQHFLNTRSSPSGLTRHIYPPTAWFGVGIHAGWSSILDYSGKVLCCTLFELLVKLQTWQLSSTTALWLGSHWYGWGKL